MAKPFLTPSGTYIVRLKTPKDLKEALGHEYKRSLKTKDPKEALRLFPAALAEAQRYFEEARAQGSGLSVVSQADAHQIAARWFRAKQDALEKSGRFTDLLVEQPVTFMDERYGPEEGVTWLSLRDYENEGRDVSPEDRDRVVLPHLQSGLRDLNIPIPPKGSESFDRLLSAFREHVYKLSDWASKRYEGDAWPLGFEVAAIQPLAGEAKGSQLPAKNRKLSALFKIYSQEKKLNFGDNRSTQKTLISYQAIVNRFIELYGDLDVTEINRELVGRYRADLAKMPAKGVGIRGLPAQALISKAAREKLPLISEPTIRNRVLAMSAVLACGVRQGWLSENPIVAGGVGKAAKHAATRKQRATKQRNAFSEEELQTIFTSPIFTEPNWQPPRANFGKAWYWLPLLYYYTGARREELAQLQVEDLKQVDGYWCLSILFAHDDEARKDDHRTVKTTGSRRLVPVHADLLARGLLAYARSVPAKGLLFPLLKPDRRGYFGTNFGKRWAEYLRETLGLDSPVKAIHGFRHTFKTLCRSVGIPEDVHDAITGHTGGGGVARDYGAMPLRRMAEELAKFSSVRTPALDIYRVVAAP